MAVLIFLPLTWPYQDLVHAACQAAETPQGPLSVVFSQAPSLVLPACVCQHPSILLHLARYRRSVVGLLGAALSDFYHGCWSFSACSEEFSLKFSEREHWMKQFSSSSW